MPPDGLRRNGPTARVTIAANNAVAFLWLRRRVAAYLHDHQDVDIRLVASGRHPDFLDDGIDLAVRYGDGDWPGISATLLFAEEVFPVCSTAYLSGRPRPRSAEDLQHGTLLQMDQHAPDWVTWTGVLRAMGAEPGEALVARGPALQQLSGSASGGARRSTARDLRSGRVTWSTSCWPAAISYGPWRAAC